MSVNLLCDHRVPDARWREAGGGGAFAEIAQVGNVIKRYHDIEVRPLKPGIPAYLRPENATNAVTLDDETTLVTVLSLSYLGRVYAAARKIFKIPEFEHFELRDPDDATEVNDRLTSFLPQSDSLRAILEALKRYRRSKQEKYRRLTWAADWESFRNVVHPASSPSFWLQAVGVAPVGPVWIAAFRYPVVMRRKKRIQLFRPTQLDAGWFAYHFPSPRETPLRAGGHAMFVSQPADLRPGALVNEYIHESIDFTMDHWEAAGRLLANVERPVSGDLARQRDEHAARLAKHYGGGVRDWMSVCK